MALCGTWWRGYAKVTARTLAVESSGLVPWLCHGLAARLRLILRDLAFPIY